MALAPHTGELAEGRHDASRAALVTGASSGIGLAIARMLAETGHAVTMVSRNAAKLETACQALAADGLCVRAAAADVAHEPDVRRAVAEHEGTYQRLDVLVNNAGIGVASPLGDIATKHVDLQFAVNLRQIVLFYREALPLLERAGREHAGALVVNVSSITGKRGEALLSVYSATKHGVVGWTEAMNRELGDRGIKSTALCPGFVDTPMTAPLKGHIAVESMITATDIAESVRFLLTTSRACVVPEILFERPGGGLGLEAVDG